MFKISNKDLDTIRNVSKAWPRRTRALRKAVAFEAAAKTKAMILEKLPAGKGWDPYRESLEVTEVEVGKEGSAYVLRSRNQTKKVEELEEGKTLLYVKANRRMKAVRPFVEVLEKFSPWTVDTIPSFPQGPDSIVRAQDANKNKVDKVRKDRIKDSKLWRVELSRVGIKTNTRPGKNSMPAVVSDVALSGYKLEFGIGRKPAPHWRPSIREVKDTAPRKMARNPKITRLFTNPSFTGWKRWEKIQTGSTIRPSQARDYIPFQTRLGIRT